MNKYFSRTYDKLRNEIMYTPLTEDAEILDHSPDTNKFSTPTRGYTIWQSSRRLFQNNRSFKINRKVSDSKQKKGGIRNLMKEFRNKIQTWSVEIKNSFQRGSTECKTPNCVTPNRRIRCMLGRTPEKLYSPFAIETPPSLKWQKFSKSSNDRIAHFYGWVTPPKRQIKSKKMRKFPLKF